jgi:hypothetical protein
MQDLWTELAMSHVDDVRRAAARERLAARVRRPRRAAAQQSGAQAFCRRAAAGARA